MDYTGGGVSVKKKIAIVDDEPDIVELLSYSLHKENFLTESFSDGAAFIRHISENNADLIILDLMLPGYTGIEICKIIKASPEKKNIPIIMLTAKDSETDRVLGLELGADDYIVKPFSVKELIARVKAVLRRTSCPQEKNKEETNLVKYKELVIDRDKFSIKVCGKTADLTFTEFKILEILVSKPDRVFSREVLLEKLWGSEKIVIDRTIDVHVVKIREKIGKYGKFIKAVRGVGYKFEAF
ncbi:response regulator transcription factor [candidate division WOR-3 bacterium]|nr:response regulator transcription factor [candidate division WOR-3 bacterium]